MKLPKDTVIPEAKITRYLLQQQATNDKSKFLAQAGYTLKTAQQLKQHLCDLYLTLEAEYLETDRFGDRYQIIGALPGINGAKLKIVSIWMTEHETGITKFITLYPHQEK
jgi:hypothetical protein